MFIFFLEASQSSGQWRVFITTKPTRLLPEPLLYLSYPLSWDSVQMETSTKPDVGSFDLSLNIDLLSAITSSLNVSRFSLVYFIA